MKTRQVDETNFYLLLLYRFDMLFFSYFFSFFFFRLLSTGSLWSHFKTFVFPSQNWFRTVHSVLFFFFFEIQIYIYLQNKRNWLSSPSSQAFDIKKIEIYFSHSKTHKSNWIPIYLYMIIIQRSVWQMLLSYFRCVLHSI